MIDKNVLSIVAVWKTPPAAALALALRRTQRSSPYRTNPRVFRATGAENLYSRRTNISPASTLRGYRAVPEFFAPPARKTCIAAAQTSPLQVLYAAIV